MAKKHEITPRQRMFVEYYIQNGMNGTQAAISAGYSKKTAQTQASWLLSNPYVKPEVEKRISELLSETQAMTLKWLRQVMAIAEYDPRKSASWGPAGVDAIDSEGIDDNTAMAIQEISSSTSESGVSVKIKSYDKTKALDLLAKYIGIIGDGVSKEQQEQNGVDQLSPAERRERILELNRKLNG